MYIPQANGIISVAKQNNNFSIKSRSKFLKDIDIISIEEDSTGNLWLGTASNKVHFLGFKDKNWGNFETANHKTISNGIPLKTKWTKVQILNNHIICFTPNGIYKYNFENKNFVQSDKLKNSFPGDLYRINFSKTQKPNSIWLSYRNTDTSLKTRYHVGKLTLKDDGDLD